MRGWLGSLLGWWLNVGINLVKGVNELGFNHKTGGLDSQCQIAKDFTVQ